MGVFLLAAGVYEKGLLKMDTQGFTKYHPSNRAVGRFNLSKDRVYTLHSNKFGGFLLFSYFFFFFWLKSSSLTYYVCYVMTKIKTYIIYLIN